MNTVMASFDTTVQQMTKMSRWPKCLSTKTSHYISYSKCSLMHQLTFLQRLNVTTYWVQSVATREIYKVWSEKQWAKMFHSCNGIIRIHTWLWSICSKNYKNWSNSIT